MGAAPAVQAAAGRGVAHNGNVNVARAVALAVHQPNTQAGGADKHACFGI
jgi:hypothetical protein